ncbi:hypothetical protein BXY66_1619 [Shimia isoporae]|uniref:Uncharacterized protein n=1 Tax=Shimia isoporae TaxID=647720 RepID=A0A4R1NW97_9RHOB|nr:hypothetical protein BXY66_1619 [Shimia isoporae]
MRFTVLFETRCAVNDTAFTCERVGVGDALGKSFSFQVLQRLSCCPCGGVYVGCECCTASSPQHRPVVAVVATPAGRKAHHRHEAPV